LGIACRLLCVVFGIPRAACLRAAAFGNAYADTFGVRAAGAAGTVRARARG